MRAVVQRVARARVTVDDRATGAIDVGLLVLVGVSHDDGDGEAAWLADRVANLRIFPDDEGKMNRSLVDIGGSVLLVSQFTLYGDARKGRRPSFIAAAQGSDAEAIYESVANALRGLGIHVETGRFGASMDVELINRGPVTILLDSAKTF